MACFHTPNRCVRQDVAEREEGSACLWVPCRRVHFRSREFLDFPTVTAGVRAEAGVWAGGGGAHPILGSPAYPHPSACFAYAQARDC
jgi:hypothetical protein